MSELSSYVQRSSHAVLSAVDLAAIQQQVRSCVFPAGAAQGGAVQGGAVQGGAVQGGAVQRESAAIDFELRPGGPVFGEASLQSIPAAWVGLPISADANGLGLCLPVDGAGHLGVAMNRWGDATWFSIDDGQAWGDTPPACQLLDDVCRARLGLPTEPPERLPDWYWLGRWLTDLTQSATDGSVGALDVISVASAHPAVEMSELADLDMHGLAGFVIERHREHTRVADWACIRLDSLSDVGHPLHDIAAALDVGGFSRWASAASPPLSDLAARLTTACTPLGLRLLGSVISDMVLRHRIGD